jgi:hypothetical protein
MIGGRAMELTMVNSNESYNRSRYLVSSIKGYC